MTLLQQEGLVFNKVQKNSRQLIIIVIHTLSPLRKALGGLGYNVDMRSLIVSYKNTGNLHHAYALEGDKKTIIPELYNFIEKDLKINIEKEQ